MIYVFIALFAYFLISLEVILDKFMITSRRVSHPAVYAFYSGILSFFTLIFAPFGWHPVSLPLAVAYLAVGAVFVYGILALFFAVRKNEASRVTPIVGVVGAIVTYFISYSFLAEGLNLQKDLGIAILILGGIFLSLDLRPGKGDARFYSGFPLAVVSGMLIALSLSAVKKFYVDEGAFFNVFIWTRLGLTFGAFTFLLVPRWRSVICKSIAQGQGKIRRENQQTGKLFIFNKILGGTGSILTQYSISLGSVAVVNALISVEYAFIFIFGLVLSLRFPAIFQEERTPANIFKKLFALILISIGIVLVFF